MEVLAIVKTGESRNITMDFNKFTLTSDYKVGSQVYLRCDGYSHIPDESISVQWLFNNGNSLIPITRQHTINTTNITVDNRYTK